MPEHQPTEHEHIVYALYNTLLLILCPVVLGAAVTRDWKRIGPRALRERWGIYPRVRTGQPVVWMHAASVGETVAAGPIVRELIALRPDVHIVFSSITATGRETAEQILPNVDHIFFPFDIPFVLRRALRAIHPTICVTVETELWPNFIWHSREAGAHRLLVNGRFSDRSFRRASLPPIRTVFQWMLSNLDEMNMQTDGDADRARALGADPAHVHVIGNSKFDQAAADLPSAEQVAADMRFPVHAPTLVAGSTHAGEDEAVLDAFLQVRQSVPGSRLIIAPRRLERVPELRDALSQRKLSARFRSEEKTDDRPIADSVDCPVFVLDTIGELRKAYGLARLAYVGGSLVPVGGHDILQPLAQGKPVLFGPHTQNCREIAVTAIEKGAARRIHNADELAAEWIRILQDENAARIMSQAGLDLIEKNRGAARKYAERIASYIEG